MEALLGRGKTGIQDLDGSQEPPVFHDKPEVESTTSAMGPVSIAIRLYLKAYSRKKYGKADGLSRRPNWQKGVERDNEDQTLIRPEWIRGVETVIEEGNLRERIKKAQEGDKRVVKAVEELKKAGVKTSRDEEWEIEDGIVLKEGRIYMPEGELREEVIQLYHNTPVEGYRGRWKTTELVTRNYW